MCMCQAECMGQGVVGDQWAHAWPRTRLYLQGLSVCKCLHALFTLISTSWSRTSRTFS